MANAEQVAIIKHNPLGWNQWHRKNSDVKVDLTEADLSGAVLMGAVLDGADFSKARLGMAALRGAYLSGANFTGAYLNSADMSDATLTQVNLTGTTLTKVNFSNADLRGADLRGANLSYAHLANAHLDGANLSEAFLLHTDLSHATLDGATVTDAIMWMTRWDDVDLRQVNGLSQIKHIGPSTIGSDTLYASHGQIPDAFLRGCGVSNDLIDFNHTLAKTPLFTSSFLSYGAEDVIFATRLYDDLQDNNVRCWDYTHSLEVSNNALFQDRVNLYRHKLIVILSRSGIDSQWFSDEMIAALKYEKREHKSVLVPITLDTTIRQVEDEWAQKLRDSHPILDFTKWEQPLSYNSMFERLLIELQQAPLTE